jgi:hypothetical protein
MKRKVAIISTLTIAVLMVLGCRSLRVSPNGLAGTDLGNEPTKVITVNPLIEMNPVSDHPDSVLVYYALDTGEPFMRMAVAYEVRSLAATCHRLPVNWVVVLNSVIASHDPRILVCRRGVMRWQQVPELDSLTPVLVALRDTQLTSGLIGYKRNTLWGEQPPAFFGRYPLAHHEVLGRILAAVASLFPEDQFGFFVHFKSHGSTGFVLTGLSDELEQKKISQQMASWDTVNERRKAQGLAARVMPKIESEAGALGDEDIRALRAAGFGRACGLRCLGDILFGKGGMSVPDVSYLHQVDLGDIRLNVDQLRDAVNGRPAAGASNGKARIGVRPGMGDVGMGDVGMGDVGMGDVGMGDVGMGDVGMGDVGMGDVGMGDVGMGVSGLSAGGYRGLTPDEMVEKLKAIRKVDFALVESCKNNVGWQFVGMHFKADDPNFASLYSPVGSIWYRNFDWDSLLTLSFDGQGVRSSVLHALAVRFAAKIPNYVPIEPRP